MVPKVLEAINLRNFWKRTAQNCSASFTNNLQEPLYEKDYKLPHALVHPKERTAVQHSQNYFSWAILLFYGSYRLFKYQVLKPFEEHFHN